jgi:hypothetical protein
MDAITLVEVNFQRPGPTGGDLTEGPIRSSGPVSSIPDQAIPIVKIAGLSAAMTELDNSMNLVWEGDSIIHYYDIPTLTAKALGLQNFAIFNHAVSGQTVAQMVGQYATEGRLNSPAVTGKKGFYFVGGGTNDIDADATALSIYNNQKTLWAAARADGYKVVAFTLHANVQASAPRELVRRALNVLIKSDITLYDYLADLDRVMGFGMNPYYIDNVHPTPLAARALAECFASALSLRKSVNLSRLTAEFAVATVTDTNYLLYIQTPDSINGFFYGAGFIAVQQDAYYRFSSFVIGNGSNVVAGNWFLHGIEITPASGAAAYLLKGDYRSGLASGTGAIGLQFSIVAKLNIGDVIRVALATTAANFATYSGPTNSRITIEQLPDLANAMF